MALPYSTQFALGNILGPSTATVATVPAGVRWVVRDIELFNTASSSTTIAVTIQGLAYIWNPPPIVADGWSQWEGRVVMIPTQAIAIQVGSAATVYYVISGYQLTG